MTRTFVARAASMVIIAMAATSLPTPVSASSTIRTIRVARAFGPCPPPVAEQLTAVAEKACKRQGKDYVVTYMSCTDGVADFNYACI
jgi:hypothetical protein